MLKVIFKHLNLWNHGKLKKVGCLTTQGLTKYIAFPIETSKLVGGIDWVGWSTSTIVSCEW